MPTHEHVALLETSRSGPPYDDLDDLFRQTGAPLAARATSLQAWFDTEPSWTRLDVRVGGDDGPLRAAAVLAHRHRAGILEVRRAGPQDEPGWLAAADLRAARLLAEQLRSTLDATARRWRLRLTALPADSPVLPQLMTALPCARSWWMSGWPVLEIPAGTRGESLLTRNTRSALAKARNRIRGDGHRFDLAWEDRPDRLAGLLDEVVDLHRARNRQVRGAAGLDDPDVERRFRAVAAAHAAQGRARLLTARLDDALAAFALCFADTEGRQALEVYANLAHPQWLRYSVGALANAEVVLAAARDGFRVVDWGLGVQRYKASHASRIDSVCSLAAASSPAVSRLGRLTDLLGRG